MSSYGYWEEISGRTRQVQLKSLRPWTEPRCDRVVEGWYLLGGIKFFNPAVFVYPEESKLMCYFTVNPLHLMKKTMMIGVLSARERLGGLMLLASGAAQNMGIKHLRFHAILHSVFFLFRSSIIKERILRMGGDKSSYKNKYDGSSRWKQ